MKKIPQPENMTAQSSEPADENPPVFPGTESPRSLGEMMKEAETVQAEESVSVSEPAQESANNGKPRRVKKMSRSQARRHARERTLQALYQWDVSSGQSSEIREQFLKEQDMSRVDVDYFVKLYNGVSHAPQKVDDAMESSLDRPIQDLDPIERAVLRICTYEMTQCLDIPVRVIINEGIEITKRFGADKGHRYINGVLDKLATEVRPLEMQRR